MSQIKEIFITCKVLTNLIFYVKLPLLYQMRQKEEDMTAPTRCARTAISERRDFVFSRKHGEMYRRAFKG